jgi:outer membrane protein OmpA-like peptidoglycan-associated protein
MRPAPRNTLVTTRQTPDGVVGHGACPIRAPRLTPSAVNNNTRSLALALPAAVAAALLVACGAPPVKPLPAPGPAVPGSAPGPVYDQAASGAARSWSPQMETVEKQLASSLSGTPMVLARTTDERLWLTLPGDVAFEPNRSALKPVATGLLDKVAAVLRGQPQLELRIVGHTDSKGSAAGNDALSLDRAASARDWLVARGLSPVKIGVAGRGSRDPVGSNDDEAGRAANRRVEILIGERALRSGSK